ncbi:hypothetical protein AM588_10005334 [Phytophthora nicotianae]|uniref:Transmembrane protein n=1 Tax=Phytophthora nicotianae TaxID=4792 RepID=A0A0W8DG37_PHYNI|nr:hypothetical protein AM588_10005334 [Phytophthora nicotianae]
MSPTSPTPANYDHKLRSLTPVERSEAMEQNDISIDSNTIVEVSLRLERFVICVAAALAASGAFLFLMSRKATLKILEGSGEELSREVNDVVDNYKSVSAYLQITASTFFAVFCETLIFPTLATYLHNCSLYPGDQPARVHSVLKERGIFWGLKMIIIIMNIGFTSVNINTERKDPSRRLTSSDELETIVMPIKTSWVVDSDAGVLHSILRTSMTGTTTPFAFEDTCKWSKHNDDDAAQQWGAWADDVDTTSVSFSFPSHAWNTALLSSHPTVPTRSAEIPLRDYLATTEKYMITDDWDVAELYSTFKQATGCVYATSTSVLEQLHLRPAISIASYTEDENSALVYSSSNQFVQEVTATQTPHEVLTVSMGKLAWQLSPLHIRHDAACVDDSGCLGLSLPFTTDDGVLLVGKEALATKDLMHPMALVTLHPASIPDMARPEIDTLTSWHRLVSSNGMLVRPSPSECTSLVDAYLTHLEANHFYLDNQLSHEMYSAALFYLVQRGVPTSFADAISRRRLAVSAAMASSGSGSGNTTGARATTDIEVNVPTATALVTVAGCIFIVLLMLCVIYLPTARVKLSPDTTPAAQYVQILTDDLYPDLVHKKRLRFANGDCLLFNEYVVDAIVLHAKRDQTKKIYL